MDTGATHLSVRERTLLRGIAFGLSAFEPFPAFFAPGSGALQALIEKGLVEEGRSVRPAVAERGYRLTGQGWAVLRRECRPTLLADLA